MAHNPCLAIASDEDGVRSKAARMHNRTGKTLALVLATTLAGSAHTSESPRRNSPDNGVETSPEHKWHLYEPVEFGEKRLTDAVVGDNPHVYRFLCYPSFAPPFSVRLHVHEAGNGTAFIKRMDRRWGRDKKPYVRLSRHYAIDTAAVSKFLERIESLDFWRLQPKRPLVPGCDGSTWVLEGLRGGAYNAVSRWSPRPGDFRDTAMQLLSFGGVDACSTSDLLGQHELRKLEYIGFMVTGDPPKPAAIVKTPDGLIEKARLGDYLGTNFGVIREITEDSIRITEVVYDGRGGYFERENRLNRKVAP